MVTRIWRAPSGSPVAAGMVLTMASKSGWRSVPGAARSVVAVPALADGVEDGEVELMLVGVEVDEEVVDLVEDFLRARVGAVDLVDDDDGRQFGFEGLGKDVARLRQRAFGGVDEEHDAIDHFEGALDFAAEVGVAGGVDDVDFAAAVVDGGVLGEDGDAALALELVGVHDALGDLLIGAEGAGLAQHGVDEGGLAVVDVGDDGDIAYRLGH